MLGGSAVHFSLAASFFTDVRVPVEELKARGILVKDTQVDTIRIAPPLIITRDQVDWAVEQFGAVLTEGD